MSLSAGTRLGPYEVQSALGAGGMGEVYKARDTRLDRTVAIKILPEALAGDSQFRERFDREARTISQLDDPHICALYDIGTERGTSYLVMQYLEGETLASRLLKGPLAVSEVVKIGFEVTKALERAHRAGVVHRDLKPGNVMLTRSGAKLLDFGLAKTHAVASGGASLLPTTPVSITAQGTILGTFQYMAPEQVEGQEADPRTDLFALGAMLFEMVTGRPAFQGKTQASLIGSILRDDPMLTSDVAASVPAPLARVIRTCLAKNPDDRLQTAHDVALQLQWILEGGSQTAAPAPVVNTGVRRWRTWLPWSVAGIMTAVGAGAVGGFLERPAKPAPVVRFEIPTPDSFVSVGAPRISPDGRTLAFNAIDAGGESLVWLRPLSALTAHPLPGTEGTGRPFWSPDSRFLGFFAGGKLKKIDVNGGPTQNLCDAPATADGSWNESGVILYDGGRGIWRVSASGGASVPAVNVDTSKESSIGWPEFLPDGRHFLYLSIGQNRQDSMYRVGTLDSTETVDLMPSQTQASFAYPNHLVFARDNTLLARGFDPKTLKVSGEPLALADHVTVDSVGLALFSVSHDGTLVYRTAGGGSRMVLVDREGKELETLGDNDMFAAPAISVDGRFISYSVVDPRAGKLDVWVRDVTRSISSRFTVGPGDNTTPIWSPDGSQVVFTSTRTGQGDLFMKPASGQGEETLLLKTDERKTATDWSRDGRYIAYQSGSPTNQRDLWVLPTFGDRKPIPVVATQAEELNLTFSPDGRFVAYRSDESGTGQIYVQTFPKPANKVQVSNAGGADPVWRADSKELIYRAPDQRVMAVDVHGGEDLQPSVPRPLFLARLDFTSVIGRNRFTMMPDGQRFLLISPPGRGQLVPTTVVLNWNAALK